LRDRIHPGIEAQYPKRELLGLGSKDLELIEELILSVFQPQSVI